MTGSITGPTQVGAVAGFGRVSVMIGDGNPTDVVFAPSGTYLRDHVNDAHYLNNSAGAGAGSSWIVLGSQA